MGRHEGAIHTAASTILPPQQAAVDLRMEGLHPPIHHFRKTRVLGHFGHRQAHSS